MLYWKLLQKSKGTIKLKKNQVDTLLDYCQEWHAIIGKQRKAKTPLDEDEIGFIGYVCEAFKEWFKDEPKIEKIKEQWAALYEELRHEQLWWQQKKTEIVAFLKKQKEKMEKEAREALMTCSSWIGSLCEGLGVVMIAVGVVVLAVGAV